MAEPGGPALLGDICDVLCALLTMCIMRELHALLEMLCPGTSPIPPHAGCAHTHPPAGLPAALCGPSGCPTPSAVVFHRRGEALPWAGQIFLPHADVWVLQGISEGTRYPCMGGWPESSREPQGQGWGSER